MTKYEGIAWMEHAVEWIYEDERSAKLHCDVDGEEDLPKLPPFPGNLAKCVGKRNLRAKLKHWLSKINDIRCLPVEESDAYAPYRAFETTSSSSRAMTKPSSTSSDARPPHRPQASSDFHLPLCVRDSYWIDGIVLVHAGQGPRVDARRRALLACCAQLYRQLVWWRHAKQREVSSADGFYVVASLEMLEVSRIRLEMPSKLAGPMRLRVFARLQATLEDGQTVLEQFVTQTILSHLLSRSPWEYPSLSFPGEASLGVAMLLPDSLRRTTLIHQEEESKNSHEASVSIISTTTGSLVLRCSNVAAFRRVLEHVDERHSDTNAWSSLLSSEDDNTRKKCVTFIKFKVPATFGSYWDTATVAVNCTRARLQALLKQRKPKLTTAESRVIKTWLQIYPVDCLVSPYGHIIMSRDVGVRLTTSGMPWQDFCSEFATLIEETILFQKLSGLVHGDIHANNVLVDPRRKSLVLIDWDEALREKPCSRLTLTAEECAQYPKHLVDFPVAYTQHQFLHLFDYLLARQYESRAGRWNEFLLDHPVQDRGKKARYVVRERMDRLFSFLRMDQGPDGSYLGVSND